MRAFRRRLSLSVALVGLCLAFLGGMGYTGSFDAPAAEAAPYRPFDNSLSDEAHSPDALSLTPGQVQWTNREVLAQATSTTEIQLLGYNDFHGGLDVQGNVVTANGPVPSGGIEYLATHMAKLKAANPNTVIVTAGDLIGASPLLSGLFHDEPTIEAANLLQTDFSVVGNHEFDEGRVELLRMQNGGCHPVDGCKTSTPFPGAKFKFLAANVFVDATGKTLLPAYQIKELDGIKVAFVGVVTSATPTIVSPSGVEGLTFKDEAASVNALVPLMKADGASVIVLLIHEGGTITGNYNTCTGLTGPIANITAALDPAIDVVFSGHSHVGYICDLKGRPLVQGAFNGRLISRITLTVDKTTKKLAKTTAENLIVTRDVEANKPALDLLARYKAVADPLAKRVLGKISGDVLNKAAPSGESPMGSLIADSQLFVTAKPGRGDAVIAFMNPGGVRSDLLFKAKANEGDGVVTYEKAFTVQPFGNSLVTMTLTGEQIRTALEQQWLGQPFPRILQVSKGFTYAWDASKPDGSKVDASTIKLNGVVIEPAKKYRVTVNSFLADGGDNFAVLKQGNERLGGAVDLDALEAMLTSVPVTDPPATNRITALNIPAQVPSPTAAPASPTVAPPTTAPATQVPATLPPAPTVIAPRPPSTGSNLTVERPLSASILVFGLVLLAVGATSFAATRRR